MMVVMWPIEVGTRR